MTAFLLLILLLVSPVRAADQIDITVFSADTGGATQDVEISGFGTPTGVLFFLSRADQDVDTAIEDHGLLSIGAYDGTNSAAMRAWSTDAASPSSSERNRTTGACIYILDGTDGTADGTATCSFTGPSNGVRITWTDAPSFAYQILVVMFGGDTQFSAGNFTTANIIGNSTAVSVGFEPDQGILYSVDIGTPTHFRFGFGVFNNGTSLFQGASNLDDLSAFDPTQVSTYASNQYALHGINSSNPIIGCEVSNFSASGFDCITRVAARAVPISYAVWKLGGSIMTWGGYEQVPASTGSATFSSSAFQPGFAFYIPTINTTLNQHETAEDGSGLLVGYAGFCVMTTGKSQCVGTSSEDAVSISNTASYYDDVGLMAYKGDQSIAYKATFSGFVSSGVSLNFSSVSSGAYVLGLTNSVGVAVSAQRRRVAPWSFR